MQKNFNLTVICIFLLQNTTNLIPKMNILIVEDEIQIAESVVEFLKQQKYVVELAQNFAMAKEKIKLYKYDCMIVDIMLPDGSGLDLIRMARNEGVNMGIIVVSAHGETEQRIYGLEIGADDYIAKPFSLAELNARINAVIRRRNFSNSDEFIFNEIKIILSARRVYINNNEIVLTRKEYDMLLYLITNRNRVLSKESIVEHLWGDSMGLSADSFDFIYTHIRNLRAKLEAAGSREYIKTVYAIGYKFSEE